MTIKIQCEHCEELVDRDWGNYFEVNLRGPINPSTKALWDFCSTKCVSEYFKQEGN